jgi:hypothetical protein
MYNFIISEPTKEDGYQVLTTTPYARARYNNLSKDTAG